VHGGDRVAERREVVADESAELAIVVNHEETRALGG
jgi:hypothetical protein